MSFDGSRHVTGGALASVELHRVQMPLRRPHRAAHGTEAERELVIVRAELETGAVGWGECSALARPTYTAEYAAGAWAVLRDLLVPAALATERLGVVGHPFATAALVTAVTDAQLRDEDRNLAQVLAGANAVVPAGVSWCAVVGRADSVDDAHASVATRLESGAAQIKLKVGPSEQDLATVEAIRVTWPDLALAVDCNGTADDSALARLDRLGLVYIEQPAPADALVRSAAWAAQLDTPIALDESIDSTGSMDVAVALGAGSIVNIKPARLGGPQAGAQALDHAANCGLKSFVGGMVESGLGRAAALAVAAKAMVDKPVGGLATDLGPSAAYFAADLTVAIELGAKGLVEVPSGPGIGRTPDPDRLDDVTVDFLRLCQ